MKIVIDEIGQDPIISANGFISRDLFNVCDKKNNFYMIGSMGLASSIGLGVAIKNLCVDACTIFKQYICLSIIFI